MAPYACTALALVLVTLGLVDQMPPGWWWAPPQFLGTMLLSEAVADAWLRWRLRKLGFVRCGACQRNTLDIAFEVFGWCLACGHVVKEPWTAGRRPASRT